MLRVLWPLLRSLGAPNTREKKREYSQLYRRTTHTPVSQKASVTCSGGRRSFLGRTGRVELPRHPTRMGPGVLFRPLGSGVQGDSQRVVWLFPGVLLRTDRPPGLIETPIPSMDVHKIRLSRCRMPSTASLFSGLPCLGLTRSLNLPCGLGRTLPSSGARSTGFLVALHFARGLQILSYEVKYRKWTTYIAKRIQIRCMGIAPPRLVPNAQNRSYELNAITQK